MHLMGYRFEFDFDFDSAAFLFLLPPTSHRGVLFCSVLFMLCFCAICSLGFVNHSLSCRLPWLGSVSPRAQFEPI